MPGLFLSLDGVDGAGKSTQVPLLAEWLTARGEQVVVCRDPGGTTIGDEIRRLLLDTRSTMNMTCEMLLYMASRAQLLHEIILPAIARDAIVLSDRFLLSTIVYQGHAGGIDPEVIRSVGLAATQGVFPDWTGVLDVDWSTSAGRRTGPADRIESRPVEFHRRVRQGFLDEAQRDPERISVIDASAATEVVFGRLTKEVHRVLGAARRTS